MASCPGLLGSTVAVLCRVVQLSIPGLSGPMLMICLVSVLETDLLVEVLALNLLLLAMVLVQAVHFQIYKVLYIL